MTIECYHSNCKYHSCHFHGEGPFCDEPECKVIDEEIYKWERELKKEGGERCSKFQK